MTTDKKNKAGFSLAELLLTVAIILILTGIGFVAVNYYLRTLRFNEMNGIAKEIFLSAQNQLSKANANGSLNQLKALEQPESEVYGAKVSTGEYYVIYSGGSATEGAKAWELLMPIGAIDETIRKSGGSYVIRYNLEAATVTQVYYSDAREGYRFSDTDLQDDAFVAGTLGRTRMMSYGDSNSIIGMYQGDAKSFEVVTDIEKPVLRVNDIDMLSAVFTIPNSNSKYLNGQNGGLKVILTVKSVRDDDSDTDVAVFTETYHNIAATSTLFVLDNVASATDHFIQIVGDGFYPGEDIEIFVTLQSESKLSNVIESDHFIVNSLFGSLTDAKDTAGNIIQDKKTAQISSFRHLENLSSVVSQVNIEHNGIIGAELSDDLSWNSFGEKALPNGAVGVTNPMTNPINIYAAVGTKLTNSTNGKNYYYPVEIGSANSISQFDGKDRWISDVNVNSTSNGGLFGSISSDSFEIRNVELRNFDIQSTKAAGALVGESLVGESLAGESISESLVVRNVIAYNTESDKEKESVLQITSTSASAGGLIGESKKVQITGSAAAVYVRGSTYAGGLVGTIESGDVLDSYSSAHTVNGEFLANRTTAGATAVTAKGRPNVWATDNNGVAGGLIGDSGSAKVTHCYSTTSVYGANSNSDIFVGGKPNLKNTDNNYAAGWMFEPKPVGNDMKSVFPEIYRSDIEANTMKEAKYNYDSFWDNDYYPYKTIQELDGEINETTAAWFLKDHVGDWALPGELVDVIN